MSPPFFASNLTQHRSLSPLRDRGLTWHELGMTQRITSLDGTTASRLAFGTMQFGGRADADASRAMFEACLSHGINHFDTAHLYTDGASETLLGPMVQDQRESLIIATKCCYDVPATAANIVASCETSRQRMGLDQLDVLYLHRFDPDTPLEGSFAALAGLKAEGHIRYVGLSNFAAWQVVQASEIASKFDLPIDIIQPMYNLVKRQAEVEILPMATALGLHIAPYSPLGGGLLTGKYNGNGTGRLTEDDRYAARYEDARKHQTAKDLNALARRLNTHPATLAVAWAAAHPSGPTPIISARSTEQLAPSLAALDYDLTSEGYAEISALSEAPPPATDRSEEHLWQTF